MGKGASLCYEEHPRWVCGAVVPGLGWAGLAAGLRSWRIWDVAISQAIFKTF